jgi:flavin reductase (DIM6/NTAB) family NADH-FMN oxidoreductase RutF/DNA-binding transcriptional LysR family regulator
MAGLAENLPDPALRQRFLNGMGLAACTVNVVTTEGPAGRHGVTVSAMASVSADMSRPTLLVCVHEMSLAAQAIIDNGIFCVNILRDDQSFISDCFAGRIKMPDGNKFSCTSWTTLATGAPRVVDVLAAFDCRILSAQKIGTHHVIVGSVEEIFALDHGSPLIYANRAYGTPSRIDNSPNGRAGDVESVKLGAFHTFGPYVVPQVLTRLAAKGRQIDLKLVEGDHRRVLEAIKAGDVDLALIYDFNLGDQIETELLTELQPYVLLSENHPLAQESTLSLATLAGEPLILLEPPPSGEYFLSLFSERELTPHIRFRTASFEMARGLVAGGFGYSLLATKPAATMSYDGNALVTRPLSDETRPSRVVLARRPGEELGAGAQAFAAECRGLFGITGAPELNNLSAG